MFIFLFPYRERMFKGVFMFRMSGTLRKDNKILASCVSRQEGPGSRTEKVFKALEEICQHLDLAVPIWLPARIEEFKQRSKTVFMEDSFMEEIPFDSFSIEVIEE